MINVNKPFLPPIEDYIIQLRSIWDRQWITNNGPCLLELENNLKNYFQNHNVLFVGNGTIAIQLAIKALDITGEIITTPFSYVATTTSILWENCKPVFVDIDEDHLCINPKLIENSITENTSAILATHVYGNPCDVLAIEKIAKKYNLKVIYDAAHAFGVKYINEPLVNYGDISTISFHATKLFHTVEGGAIIWKQNQLNEKLFLLRSFGHIGDDYYSIGINGKNSELHAAMGLAVFPYVEEIIKKRKFLTEKYENLLINLPITKPKIREHTEYNYAYYPIILSSEEILLNVKEELYKNQINTRRYFYPSLNNLSYLNHYYPCPVSEDISNRALCLPLYHDLPVIEVERVAEIIKSIHL